jgi:hypothetical protein
MREERIQKYAKEDNSPSPTNYTPKEKEGEERA